MYKGNTDKIDYCLLDSVTTHLILTNKVYFLSVTLCKTQIKTISSPVEIIDGSRNATIMLPNGTILNLLSFKDVRHNGYHLETLIENSKECLCITSYEMEKRTIHEKFEATASGLYCIPIRAFESYTTTPRKLVNPEIFGLWHDCLGHLRTTMMRRIAKHTRGHSLKGTMMLMSKDYIYESCLQGKLIIRPSIKNVGYESLSFLQHIHGDICGLINPASGPFRYFMVIVDASYKWSHVCLLSTHNIIFARLLAQIIKLRAYFPNYPIKNIRIDNTHWIKRHCSS
ncbi:hypothetical protein Pfo_013977 [Paulownia fortunei]|nr:hypothetical protein Pfo_013977 [Paulownia fortunei]